MSFAGIGSDFIADLESWARECEIFKPLNPASVSFATFEDVATLHDCTRVLDRIADRSNFLIDKRAALYRRWLYSRQSVLAGLKDDSGKVVCASVVLPLTEDAYGRLSSGALDAIDIESWDIESNSAAGVGHRYLLIDAVARLDEARKGLGTRLAIYHCSQFFDPKRPPIIVSSTKVDWLQKFFAYLEFTSERDKRDGDIVNYSTDLAQPNPASNPGAPEFRASLLSLLSGYKGPATG
jgi:hypothetical protein